MSFQKFYIAQPNGAYTCCHACFFSSQPRPGAVRSRRGRAREGAVAPAVNSGVQCWYTLAALGRIRRGNGGGLPRSGELDGAL